MVTNKRNLFSIAFSFTLSFPRSESAVYGNVLRDLSEPIDEILLERFVQALEPMILSIYMCVYTRIRFYVCTRMMDTYIKNGINILFQFRFSFKQKRKQIFVVNRKNEGYDDTAGAKFIQSADTSMLKIRFVISVRAAVYTSR